MDMVESNPQMPLKVANLLCMTQKIMTHQRMSELSSRTISFSLLHLSKRIHFFQLPESRHIESVTGVWTIPKFLPGRLPFQGVDCIIPRLSSSHIALILFS